ncbi:hypothetical protein SHI21_18785 [Bacteriovorax sp. PP10]|uniref:GLUG domain-containing protein n=1 Tax=Bacteriovorax antarcticus TaxID=3088717 RepID=A0ABU5W164_9BACT|nr:hypothetical protein [Bacteriovorax sp. PP10]MEA9358289.1 hypothetical protein [Bacteriovorax sp. PP10]
MMTKHKIVISILISFLVVSCSQATKKTTAKLKLNLSGITNLSSGIGSGGAILFGKNSAGDTFGKKINATEEDLELPNGAWVFYALMWGNDSTAMNGKVHCGKSINQLNGTAATISMSLTNASCTDAEFSGGKSYLASTLNRFADIFIEECDGINATTGFSCGKQNQGSALSYRFVFNNYKKTGAGISIEGESLVSDCKMIDSANTTPNIYSSGLPINFPSGGLGTPFIGSIEFFMSSVNCDVNDPKGVYRFPLNQGLATSTAPEHHVLVSSSTCAPSTPDFTGTEEDKKNKCDQFFGTWNGTNCSGTFLPVATKFGASACTSTSPVASNIAIKHQFSLPRSVLCAPYINNSTTIGSHPFAGGEGSAIRPYKICTEWQLNQIGERNTLLATYDSANYKLVNDLDMNKASNLPGVGSYSAPICSGNVGSGVDKYHNLNPLDGHLCGSGVPTSDVGFIGTFDGANYTIANARITAESLSEIGFVRVLGTRENNGSSGTIKNINFKNLSVRGLGYVGGIAGEVNGNGLISNIKIDGGEVEARSNYSGGISGNSQGTGFIFEKVLLKKFKVRGTDYVGGLVGQFTSILRGSMFSGIVTTDQSNASVPDFAGGLVATNAAGGMISSSFSEGYIATNTNYTGGIAAKNFGTMENIYSTMAISSLRNQPGTFNAGGITAYNSGTITNCFSDTKQLYTGAGTMTYSGTVVGAGGTINTCFTDATNIPTAHVVDSYSNLRSVSWQSANFLTSVSTPTAWKLAASDGMTPRLSWENRECLVANNLLSIPLQVSTLARGTQTNPIVICTLNQFISMNGRSSSEYYRMADSINISSLSVVASAVVAVDTFNGKLNGEGNALYGLNVNIDNVMDSEVGIFKTISNGAVVSNLNLYANRVYTSADSVSNVGLLSSINNGEITNVKSFSSSIIANSFLGTLAFQNNGVIKDSNLQGVHMVGDSNYGGVVGANNGTILRASAEVNIVDSIFVPASKVGAIAGVNLSSGVINQVRASGQMNLVSGPPTKVGGLVGENGGILRNAYVSQMDMNLAINSSASGIGGLVGEDASGSIENVFFAGKIVGTQSSGDLTVKVDTDNTTDERTIGPIIGKINSGSVASALSLNDYLVWGPTNLTVSSCDPGTNTISMSGSFGSGTGALAHRSTPFLIPFTAASSTISLSSISSLLGTCPANGESLALYQSYRNFAEHGELATFTDLASLPYFATRGFNITLDDDNRALSYHLALMNGTPVPATAPIWTLEDGDEYPKLLQLEH